MLYMSHYMSDTRRYDKNTSSSSKF